MRSRRKEQGAFISFFFYDVASGHGWVANFCWQAALIWSLGGQGVEFSEVWWLSERVVRA